MTDKHASHTGLRAGFEEITRGWGADNLDDLFARLQLTREWWQAHFPLSVAEHRIARAMVARLCALADIPEAPPLQ